MSGTVSRQTSLPVALEGSLDFNTVPDLRKKLLKALRKGASSAIELDFSRVSKVDTSGIAMLVELKRIAVSKGGNVSLKGMNEQVRRMMRLARLDQIFSLDQLKYLHQGKLPNCHLRVTLLQRPGRFKKSGCRCAVRKAC